MGQVLHGSATTTEAVRRAIQHSQESLRALGKRYSVNPKTIAKWKGRTSVADLPTGPKEPRSTVLTVEEEAVVVAFRRHTLLPLDDCLYALQPTIPHLTRSSAPPSSRSLSSSTRPIPRPRAPSWRPLSPPCLTGLRSCSPTMESNSPICRRTDQVRPPGSAATPSTVPVVSTGSSIG